jgi:transcriptional regulator with XRE-family HTH domain
MYPNLKMQLWTSGIRQNKLAKMLDIDETILSRIVNGFRQPNLEMRTRIAELLRSDADWLFQTVESKPEAVDIPLREGVEEPK